MKDCDCVVFLQWALPHMHLRWPGFRKVRRQVCKRIGRRMRELDLATLFAYRSFLERHPEEWEILDALCRVTISRFHRGNGVFAFLQQEVLPELAGAARAGDLQGISVWSAGCGSGEEPYTILLLWELQLAPRFPDLDLRVLATDADPAMIERAQRARYPASSLKDLPEAWRTRAFERADDLYLLRPELAERIRFLCHDLRTEPPDGLFHLVLCRNAAFTYFDLELQQSVTEQLRKALRPGGALVVGAHEALPPAPSGFQPWTGAQGIYRKS
jgi:chemotaxis protein methyltransferase CheR